MKKSPIFFSTTKPFVSSKLHKPLQKKECINMET
jgi:hypothetical protein